jgi:hypothetical protein
MAINSNSTAFYTADKVSIGSGKDIEFFTVTVKDQNPTALDIDGLTHNGGIVDKIMQAIQTRGTIKYFNVTTTNGVITVGVEGEDTWGDSDGNVASPTATAAANMQTYLQSLGSVKCRASSTSTTEDASIDVGGTTVAVVANI